MSEGDGALSERGANATDGEADGDRRRQPDLLDTTLLDADIPAAMTAGARRLMGIGVIVLAIGAAAAAQLEAGSPLRALTVLGAFVVVPGWGVVSQLNSGPPAAMLGLAIGLSLALDVIGGLALLWTGQFTHAPAFAGLVAALAVLLSARDVIRQGRSARADVPAPQA